MRPATIGATIRIMKDKQERTLWASGIGLVLIGVALSIVTIAVVRFTEAPKQPWLYIGLVIGVFSAMAGGALAFIRARELSE
jgi:hypothetical protein